MGWTNHQLLNHLLVLFISLTFCSNFLPGNSWEQLVFKSRQLEQIFAQSCQLERLFAKSRQLERIFVKPRRSTDHGPVHSQPDTSNLIFASFAGLLQQWPNSIFPNGHSIVSGIIPRGTLLYHGANNRESSPDGMEWLSFDPEMAYVIHSSREGETSLYTYSTQRPLKVIYLDGQSASLGTAGYMDSQSLLVNRTVSEDLNEFGPTDLLRGEYRRAKGLCQVGKKLGFEGIVRMNTGFELIWCNFGEGLEHFGETNTTDPFENADDVPKHHNPAFKVKTSAFYAEAPWENTRAATLHYHEPGETRVKLDATSFISFYDRLDSLSEIRSNMKQEYRRSVHRLHGISDEDIIKLMSRLEKVLSRKNSEGWEINSSAPDWQGIVRNIIQRYSSRLLELKYIMSDSTRNATVKAMDARRLTYAMLMPYVNFSNFSTTDLFWTESAWENCKLSFTFNERSRIDHTESSRVIIGAIEGTLDRLCGTIKRIFTETIRLGLAESYPQLDYDPLLETRSQYYVHEWKQNIDELMAWLGWPCWLRCKPECSVDELCMIPMWPAVPVVRIAPFEFTAMEDDRFQTQVVPACHQWKKSKPLANLPSEKAFLTGQSNG